jgi:hypothetical protein
VNGHPRPPCFDRAPACHLPLGPRGRHPQARPEGGLPATFVASGSTRARCRRGRLVPSLDRVRSRLASRVRVPAGRPGAAGRARHGGVPHRQRRRARVRHPLLRPASPRPSCAAPSSPYSCSSEWP